jgi:hypothetical protein
MPVLQPQTGEAMVRRVLFSSLVSDLPYSTTFHQRSINPWITWALI